MDKNMRRYNQRKAAKVSKNKFSPNICIILNAFSGLMRLIICLVFLLFGFGEALAQSFNLSMSPSSFNVPRGKIASLRVNYMIKADSPVDRNFTSPAGNFMAGGEIIETSAAPLIINVRKGSGEISELINIPVKVIERTMKKNLNSLTYIRTFTGLKTILDSKVILNIATEAAADLTINSIDLRFENKKAEITVDRNYPLKAYAGLRFAGSGFLQGYWEADNRILSYVNQYVSFGGSIEVETPDALSLPTFEPGIHTVRFVITKPATQITFPVMLYSVTAKEYEDEAKIPHVPGQVIAAFKEKDISETYLKEIKDRYALKIIDDFYLKSVKLRVILFEAPENNISRIISEIRKDNRIFIAQSNRIFPTMSEPLSKMQHSNNMLKMDAIHARYKGKGVKVAILDTGVDIGHKDLKDRVVLTQNFVGDNGYVAEIHGTAVAGIIAASINGFGIEGVAPASEILAFRVCRQLSKTYPEGECYTSSAAKALDIAIELEVSIVNMSFGAVSQDGLMSKLFMEGAKRGVMFIAPAGNMVYQKKLVFPASHPDVVSVGGIDDGGNLYPNKEIASKTEVCAPATNVFTTVPENKHNFLNGTSMSSAYISGILALARERDKSINKQRLPVFKGDICKWEEELLKISICKK